MVGGIADGPVGDATVRVTLDYPAYLPPVTNPGTGTPGYWKDHLEVWPVPSIEIGGVTHTKDEAIAMLNRSDAGDKKCTPCHALISGKLNVVMGNDSSCVNSTVAAADQWMASYGPVGSGIKASSKDFPWRTGEPALSNP